MPIPSNAQVRELSFEYFAPANIRCTIRAVRQEAVEGAPYIPLTPLWTQSAAQITEALALQDAYTNLGWWPL